MTARRSRRRELSALVLGTLAALLVLEATLHTRLLPLPWPLETHLFQCYTPLDELHAISFGSPSLGLPLGRPHLRTRCSVNGYGWRHESDRWGMRNPRDRDHVEVVVLGDSQVYGQGVEEDQTLARHLERELGVSVANLGRTHAGPPHHLALFSNFALPLRPRVAIVVFFENDLDDVLEYRPLSSIRRFVATQRGPEAALIPRERLLAEDDGARPGHFWRALEQRMLVYRSLRYYAARGLDLTAFPERREPDAQDRTLAAQYLESATSLLARRARDHRIRLLLASLNGVAPDGRWRRGPTGESVVRAAAALDLPLIDLSSCLGEPERADPAAFLDRDHHLSAEGHRRAAKCLGRFVREKAGNTSP